MTDREIFKNNLNNLMNETKTKQIDLAKYAEVSYQIVSAWVQGRAYPRAEAMEKLCRFFGVRQSALTEERIDTDQDRLMIIYGSLSEDGKTKLLERAEELLKLYPLKKVKNDG